MTRSFRIALTCLVVAGAGAVLAAFLLGVFDSSSDTIEPIPVGERDPSEPGNGTDLSADGTSGSDRPSNGGGTLLPASGGVPPGLRDPEGIDLSDPEQARTYLAALLAADEISWSEVARVLGVHTEPLDDDVRQTLLMALVRGRGNLALQAFQVLQDGSLVPDLLSMLDDPRYGVTQQANVLRALFLMPGADKAAVVTGLESRLTDDLSHDAPFLRAIAARGGMEAARALVEYLERTPHPERLGAGILMNLKLAGDPEAAEIVAEALQRAKNPEALRALLHLVAQPGATTFTRQVLALDRDGQSDRIRREVYQTLARIGGKEAIDYLIAKGAEPGEYGGAALNAIAMIASADPDGRNSLMQALERAGLNPRPDAAREKLLLALGTLRHAEAIPLIVERLDDASRGVQIAAIRSLGRMKSAAQPHVEQLVTIYAAGDTEVKMKVAVALGTIGGAEAVAAMEQMVSGDDLTPSLRRTLNAALNFQRQAAEGGAASEGPGLEVRESR